MIQVMSDYPILLLFVVAALGYALGNIKIKGVSLGVSAVLFTGLAFGALDSRLQIPDIIFLLGLSLFVYLIGLSSGPAFFQSYKKNGWRDLIFTLSVLLFTGLIAAGLCIVFDFSAATITGIYTGSTTNTPALAAVIDYVGNTYSDDQGTTMIQDAVVGYSFSYPMGVLGGIIAILLLERWFKIDYQKEKVQLKGVYALGEELNSCTIEITNEAVQGKQLRDVYNENQLDVVFGRMKRGDQVMLSYWDLTLQVGDRIVAVGSNDELDKVANYLGELSHSPLEYDRNDFDVGSIFVSNKELVGKTMASLNINEKFSAVITRLRRGDEDMLVKADTVLQLGDRIRFIARREDLSSLSKFFGDSYQASSRVNLFSLGLGMVLGLLLGSIEFNFGENFNFKLGYAGGPLIVGLILGALRRTGPISWTLPYSSNQTLQQFGLIIFLATIGVRSGNTFIQSLSIEGLYIFLASVIVSLLTAIVILVVGYKFIKMPFTYLMGMVSNQPAILDFATSRAGNRIPEFGYATMFPLALIIKILIAQLLFIFLS